MTELSHEPLLNSDAPAFLDAEAMKESVRLDMASHPPAGVEGLLSETGFCQKVVQHWIFDSLTRMAVVGFMIYTGISNGHETAVDNLFLLFFLLRWMMRLCAFRKHSHCLKDGWFVYDGIIVALMIWQSLCTHDLRMASYLRTCQIAMFSPILFGNMGRAIPELMVVIKGLIAALRSVFVTLLLLASTVFIFGIMFKRATEDSLVGQTYFDTLPGSVYSLLVHGLLLDHVAEVGTAIAEESRFLAVLFFIFIFISISLVVLVLSITCEVVSAVACAEKEKLFVEHVHSQLYQLLSMYDEVLDGSVSQQEIQTLLNDRDFIRILQESEIDATRLVDNAKHLFKDAETRVPFEAFIGFLVKLRGCSSAGVNDTADLGSRMEARMDRIEHQIGELAKPLQLLVSNSPVR